MSNYAPADTKTQWFPDRYRGARINPNCGVLHTTETTGWPGYGGGATAPNYTARPDFKAKRLRWRAHFPDEMSSRALRNLSGGVETNTANAIQVELVGTCSPETRAGWIRSGKRQNRDFIYWPEPPAWAIRDLAAFIADMHQRHGIKIDGPDDWLAYGRDERAPGRVPASYGPSPVRFTFAQWRRFYGWCGHQHVPENSHGDPGNLPWDRIAAAASDLVAPKKPTPWKRPPWPRPQRREAVAYANVFKGLDEAKASEALDLTLAENPDLVGLGEWGPGRRNLLVQASAYDWIKPGNAYPPVGARRDRYDLVAVRRPVLAKGRPVNKVPESGLNSSSLPDNRATLAVWRERATGDLVFTLVVHFPAGGSKGGVFRRIAGALTPRARMVRECRRAARRIAKKQWRLGRRGYVLGDTNVHNMRLRPFISCWSRHKLRPTINRSTFDIVFAQQHSVAVRRIDTPSDHHTVVAVYHERP